MATLLLIIIYIIAIGLGIPDSAFGVAWPGIYSDMRLNISYASFVAGIVSLCTIGCSLFSVKVINRFGTAKTVLISTVLTVIALLGYSLAPNLLVICLFAVPLGLGAGAIDAAINNYMSLNYKASHMNFLHCFYGVGVLISPYVMSFALKADSWRFGYLVAASIQGVIALISILSIPLWGKVSNGMESKKEAAHKTTPVHILLKIPSLRMACLVFFTITSVEGICTAWSSTFLVESKNLLPQDAAGFVVFYYLGLTVSRFISGLLSNKISSWSIIKVGLTAAFIGILILFLPVSSEIIGVSLFLIGLGIAPVTPNLLYLTPQNFGEELSQSATGIQVAATHCGMLIAPALFGLFTNFINNKLESVAAFAPTDCYPIFLLFFLGIAVIANVFLVSTLKNQNE